MACMGLYALENNVNRLYDDHIRAKKLENGLNDNGFYTFSNNDSDIKRTNIVFFGLPPNSNMKDMNEICYKLEKEYGILIGGGYGNNKKKLFRAVVHMDVNDHDIDRALHALIELCC